jgi:acetoin utilization protein AcuB
MLVRDIMTTDLTTLREDEMMLDATLVLSHAGLRHIPIMSGDQLVGIVTSTDVKHYTPSILSGIPAEEYNRLMATTPLSKIMTRNPITIGPGQTIYEAAQLLYDRRIGCLPVMENGVLKGMVTTTDMLVVLLQLLREKGPVPSGLTT